MILLYKRTSYNEFREGRIFCNKWCDSSRVEPVVCVRVCEGSEDQNCARSW